MHEKPSNLQLLNKKYLKRKYLHKGTLSYQTIISVFALFYRFPLLSALLSYAIKMLENIKISSKWKYLWLLVNYAFLYATL